MVIHGYSWDLTIAFPRSKLEIPFFHSIYSFTFHILWASSEDFITKLFILNFKLLIVKLLVFFDLFFENRHKIDTKITFHPPAHTTENFLSVSQSVVLKGKYHEKNVSKDPSIRYYYSVKGKFLFLIFRWPILHI